MAKKAVFAAIFLSAAMIIMQNLSSSPNQVCFKEKCFSVEIASSREERGKGLMFRESLGDQSGMLFIFQEEGKHSFWMKNTLIPLDIIWMDKNKEVVFIKEDARPCKEDPCPGVAPDKNALYVLELKSGTASKIGLKTGDKAVFKLSH
jgi:hypothetical protein